MARCAELLLAACVAMLVCQQGALGSRTLQQARAPAALPSLTNTSLTQPLLPPESSASVPSPALAPGAPASCALQYLQSAGTYGTLLDLVEASSEADLLTQILDSPDVQATLLAPTDAGIQTTASSLGLSLPAILGDPLAITEILTYHILPSILQVSDIKDGYGFNTELSSGGVAQSITVNGTGLTAGFVGRQSSAPISGQITTACKIAVVPLGGLLLP